METIELPWPVSVNQAYRALAFVPRGTSKPRSHLIISEKGRAYFALVKKLIMAKQPETFGGSALKVIIYAYPPDRIRRDLDNLGKVTLDALQKAGVYDDDSQIVDLRFIKQALCKSGGRVIVKIERVDDLGGYLPGCDCWKCQCQEE